MKMPRNLWPYGIILTFVLFIGGTAGLIVLAASQKSDLIDENYYEQEIKYQSRIDSQERANQLATPATVNYDQASERIEITLPRQHAGATGKVELYRPSEFGLDQSFPLSLNKNGVQTLDGNKLKPGLWKIRVTWNFAGKEFSFAQKIVIKKS